AFKLGPENSGESQIHGRFTTIPIGFEIKGDSLSVSEATNSGALKRARMDENVLRAPRGRNKAKTFGGVEPFHGASGHRDVPLIVAAHIVRRPGKAEYQKLSLKGQVRITEDARYI